MKKILIILILVLVPFFVFADTSTSFKNNETPLVRPSVEVVFDLNSDANSISYVGFTASAPDWGDNPTVPEGESKVEFSLKLDTSSNTGEGEGYVYWILRGNKNITVSIKADPQMIAENEPDIVLEWEPMIESRSINGADSSVHDTSFFDTKAVTVLERTSPQGLDYGYAKIAVSTESVADKAPKNYTGTFILTITPNG